MTTTFQPAPDTTAPGMPHNREAEEAVIGSILVNPDAYLDVLPVLKKGGGEFYIHRLRFIWEAVARLVAQKREIDYLTVSAELDNAGKLEDIGGTAYLMGLLGVAPSSFNAPDYAEIVVEHRIRRDLLEAANNIAALAYDTKITALEASSKALTGLTSATAENTTGGLVPASEVYSRVYDKVETLSNTPPDMLPGIKTGFDDLDRRYLGGGMKDKNLLLVGCRPGEGKTAFLLQCLYQAATEQRKKVALFSLEMSADEVVERMIAAEQEINTQTISTGKLNDEEWPKFIQSIETGAHTPFFIDDTPYLTPSVLRAKTTRQKALYGLDLVIVDYIGLMLPDSGSRYENRNIELSTISRALKNLASELNCPVLAAHQLNRELEKRSDAEPQLSDLRDSGSLEQDANIVAFLYADKDPQQRNVSHMKIAKNRGGPTGTVDFLFRREYTRFYSLARLTKGL